MRLRLFVFTALLVCASLFVGNAEAAPAGAWSPAAPMPSARYLHTATLLRDGDVLVAGGTASALRYHQETNTWSSAGVLVTARKAPTATLLRDGRVLLLGGASVASGLPLASGELYDPVANTWAPSAPMNEPRTGHTATLLSDGRVLVIGGCAGVCDPREHDDWAGGEIYDPATDSWTRIRDIPVKREGHTATLLRDGRVLVVGGSASIWPAPAQMYDPATDAWRDTPEFLINRVFHTATRLVDGRVLVVGGDTAPCIVGPICVFELGMQPEIYDPTQNTWTPIDGPSPRDHVATLLKSGQVLVSGGVDWYADAVATANVYNPQTGTWTTVNSMQTARYAHTATLLKNGRVLVVGGYGDNGVVSTAELYKSDQSRHGAIR